MPYFVMDTMSEFKGLPGIFVTCVFSASLSTLSSGFNALSAVTWDDFLKETRLGCLSEQHQKNFNKMTAIFYGILSILMAFIVGQIGSVLKVNSRLKIWQIFMRKILTIHVENSFILISHIYLFVRLPFLWLVV